MKKFILLLAFLLLPVIAGAAPRSTGNSVNAAVLTLTSSQTWQALFPKNNNREYMQIENPCNATSQGIATAESLFVFIGAAAPSGTSGAFELTTCAFLKFDQYVPQQPVWVYASTISHAFAAQQTQ